MLFRKKQEKRNYDKENQKPVLRCSICTGEQVAGFKDIRSGRFEEISLIRSEKDLNAFKETYGIADEDLAKEY
ncbi:MAG: aspartate dehydrogenase [Clostridiales bacterium]|nr:aspartate dehydrogenase [Clostridiales bacterium]